MRTYKVEIKSEKQDFEYILKLNGKAKMEMIGNINCDCDVDIAMHNIVKKVQMFDELSKIEKIEITFLN